MLLQPQGKLFCRQGICAVVDPTCGVPKQQLAFSAGAAADVHCLLLLLLLLLLLMSTDCRSCVKVWRLSSATRYTPTTAE
jgi:hypothetical protein